MNISYRLALGRNEAKALVNEIELLIHAIDPNVLPQIKNLHAYLTNIEHTDEKQEANRGDVQA